VDKVRGEEEVTMAVLEAAISTKFFHLEEAALAGSEVA